MNTKNHILSTTQDCRSSNDAAWYADNGVTNYRLKEGDKVALMYSTFAKGQYHNAHLAVGTEGKIINPRTPRVTQPSVRKAGTYIYFANIDFEIEGVTYRGRCPHNALRKIK